VSLSWEFNSSNNSHGHTERHHAKAAVDVCLSLFPFSLPACQSVAHESFGFFSFDSCRRYAWAGNRKKKYYTQPHHHLAKGKRDRRRSRCPFLFVARWKWCVENRIQKTPALKEKLQTQRNDTTNLWFGDFVSLFLCAEVFFFSFFPPHPRTAWERKERKRNTNSHIQLLLLANNDEPRRPRVAQKGFIIGDPEEVGSSGSWRFHVAFRSVSASVSWSPEAAWVIG